METDIKGGEHSGIFMVHRETHNLTSVIKGMKYDKYDLHTPETHLFFFASFL